jgi:hypothetical protein
MTRKEVLRLRREYYHAHRLEQLERKRLDRLDNPDKYRDRDRRYREANRDRRNAYMVQYRLAKKRNRAFGEIADGIGLNGQELLAKARTNEIKERPRLQTERAIQVGVFGVPSFVVDGEIFWGNDRLPLLNAYLQGRLPADKAQVEEILSRPRAADRSRK